MPITETILEVYKGTTFLADAQYLDPSGNPINITGYTAKMQLRSTPLVSGILYYTLTTSGMAPQITLPSPTNGTFILTIPASDSLTFNFTQAYYDLIVTSGTGVVTLLSKGIFNVLPTTTSIP